MRNFGCGCFPLLAAAMLWGGGQGLWTALRNREATTMTCAAWIAERPSAGWVRLTDCELMVDEATYESLLGGTTVRKAWIPVRAPGVEGATPLVLRTKDKAITGMMTELLETAESADDAAIDAFAAKYAGAMRPVRDIDGLVAWGIDLKSDEYEQVQEIGGEILAEDFVVVDDGGKPSLGMSVGFTLAGVVLAGLSVGSIARRLRQEA